MKMVYCSKCTIGEDSSPSHMIRSRQRVARVIVGIGWLALAWVSFRFLTPTIAWLLALTAGWFGVSHIVAGWIGYPDCPELGAIATAVRRRYIPTRCGPWARLDDWLDPRAE